MNSHQLLLYNTTVNQNTYNTNVGTNTLHSSFTSMPEGVVFLMAFALVSFVCVTMAYFNRIK